MHIHDFARFRYHVARKATADQVRARDLFGSIALGLNPVERQALLKAWSDVIDKKGATLATKRRDKKRLDNFMVTWIGSTLGGCCINCGTRHAVKPWGSVPGDRPRCIVVARASCEATREQSGYTADDDEFLTGKI